MKLIAAGKKTQSSDLENIPEGTTDEEMGSRFTNLEHLDQESNITRTRSSSLFQLLGFTALVFVTLFALSLGAAFVYRLSIADLEIDEEFLNDRPIIGVLAQEAYENGNYDSASESYIAASYVKFIEGGGARVVPIMINKTQEYYQHIFNGINGLLFPGGGVYFNESGYATAGNILMKLALEANTNGDYFPVLGTCLGFEFLLFNALGGKDVQVDCNAYNVTNKLKFTQAAKDSNLYGSASKSIMKILSTKPVTSNFHTRCLTKNAISQNKALENFFTFLSWNYDPSTEIEYVSSMEAKKYPIYGVQFHPEKNMYEWSNVKNIPHSKEAIVTGQYFAQFLVNEARKNTHTFDDPIEETELLIFNYNVTYTGGVNGNNIFEQKYFFPL